jgi:hypothetical protein
MVRSSCNCLVDREERITSKESGTGEKGRGGVQHIGQVLDELLEHYRVQLSNIEMSMPRQPVAVA